MPRLTPRYAFITAVRPSPRLVASTLLLVAALASDVRAQIRLADESDRQAFRLWFTLLADSQFEHRAVEVTDCAALVRFSFREALRRHTPEWARRVGLSFAPGYPDVRSAPRPTDVGWPLFRIAVHPELRYAEFADARTLVSLNARLVGRDVASVTAGDLLYFRQPAQQQPDHLMVFVGRSRYDASGDDWVVYHTGPTGSDPGEVRKVSLRDLLRHPSARWRPLDSNTRFVGVFRLSVLS